MDCPIPPHLTLGSDVNDVLQHVQALDQRQGLPFCQVLCQLDTFSEES